MEQRSGAKQARSASHYLIVTNPIKPHSAVLDLHQQVHDQQQQIDELMLESKVLTRILVENKQQTLDNDQKFENMKR